LVIIKFKSLSAVVKGAIIFEELTNNGYIIFANKLSIQWTRNFTNYPNNYIDITPNINLIRRLTYSITRTIDASDMNSYIGDSSNYSNIQESPTAVFIHEAVGQDNTHAGQYYSNNIRIAFNRQVQNISALQYRITILGLIS